ncbi:DUF1858 domain-containing protein [Spirochaetota bacterium]
MSSEITKNMTFQEVLQKKPKAAYVMMKYGLHCIGCHISEFESVEDGCRSHGIADDTVNTMLAEINADNGSKE